MCLFPNCASLSMPKSPCAPRASASSENANLRRETEHPPSPLCLHPHFFAAAAAGRTLSCSQTRTEVALHSSQETESQLSSNY